MIRRRDLLSRALGATILGGASRTLTMVTATAGGAAVATGAMATRGEAQPAGTLNRVLKSGTIRIGTIGANPAWSSITPAGKPEGYDVDIGSQLAADLKVNPQFIITDTPGRIAVLQTGKADITIADFTTTVQRSTVIAFTDPYAVERGEFVVLDSRHDLQKAEDLNKPNIKVGAVQGGTAYDLMRPFIPNANIQVFTTNTDPYLALDAGQIDALGGDNLQNASQMAKKPGRFRIIGTWSTEEIGIGLPAGDFDWWRVLNVWVRQFNLSGLNARLFKKWFNAELPSLK